MQKVSRSISFRLRKHIVLLCVGTLLLLAAAAPGFSPLMRRAVLMGPWEITVQSEAADAPIRFPFEVADIDKVTALDNVLPLPDSAINIRLTKYLPDLQRTVSGVDDPSGGMIALVNPKGPRLDQEIWLDAADARKRGITSSAGGIKLLRQPVFITIPATEKVIGNLSLLWNYVFGASVYYPPVYAQITTAETFF